MKGIEMYYEVDRTQSSGIIGIWICILTHIATLTAENEEEIKEPLNESEKAGLKFNIQKMKIMASGPITSWQIDGEKWKQWQILFSEAPKITADGDYSQEIKRC